jgi:hypothetical protein
MLMLLLAVVEKEDLDARFAPFRVALAVPPSSYCPFQPVQVLDEPAG